jgi:hypothetical protein
LLLGLEAGSTVVYFMAYMAFDLDRSDPDRPGRHIAALLAQLLLPSSAPASSILDCWDETKPARFWRAFDF